ncbi:MAG: phytoene/squalene synthase family protein [Bacteroidota bacterium]
MKELFDTVSIKCSKLTTKAYSTSFSLGIYFLNKEIREPIYAIYGFVRFADEIVDSFEGYDKKELLEKFKNETYEAIEKKISLNPILNSFQHVVNSYNIDMELIDTFLKSMEMDLFNKEYSQEKYQEYILGSAEVVGLMCLCVFTEGNTKDYENLRFFAMKLGAAFQKVNFLRDLDADFNQLGRTYFPNVDLKKFNAREKEEIQKEIEEDFKIALTGIKKLPKTSKKGVYLAYIYYYSLFRKIKTTSVQNLIQSRIRISNFRKIMLMLTSTFRYKLNFI